VPGVWAYRAAARTTVLVALLLGPMREGDGRLLERLVQLAGLDRRLQQVQDAGQLRDRPRDDRLVAAEVGLPALQGEDRGSVRPHIQAGPDLLLDLDDLTIAALSLDPHMLWVLEQRELLVQVHGDSEAALDRRVGAAGRKSTPVSLGPRN
jgi:hypothetical protein